MPRAAALAHLALLTSSSVNTLAQQWEQLHSSQQRRALQAGYVMDDVAIAIVVAECVVEGDGIGAGPKRELS